MLGVLAEILWLTRILSLPVYVLIMASARVAGLPAILLVMIPADTNICEGSIYIDDSYVWFVSAGMSVMTCLRIDNGVRTSCRLADARTTASDDSS